MTLRLLAASVAAVAFGVGTASAQPVVLVPHRDHIAPAYPVAPSYGYRSYQPGLSFNLNFGSPRAYSPGYGGYGSGYGGYGSGYGSGYRYGGYTPGYGGGHYHNGHYHR